MTVPRGELPRLDPGDPIHRGYAKAAAEAFESTLYGVDMPVGAAVLLDGNIVGHGHAADRRLGDERRHAEFQALEMAHSHSLSPDTVVTTFEPCVACMEMLANDTDVSRVYFGSLRTEASDQGLVNPKSKTAADIATERGYPFEVIRLDHPLVRRFGSILLQATRRDVQTQTVTINHRQLVGNLRHLADISTAF